MNVDAYIMRRFRTTWSPSPHHCHCLAITPYSLQSHTHPHANLWWVSCEISVCEYVMLSILTHTPFKFIIQIFIVHSVVSARSFGGVNIPNANRYQYIFPETHTRTHIYIGVINIVRWICMECLSVWYLVHMHTIRYDTLYMVSGLYVQKWYTSERHDIIKRIESRFLRFFVSIHIPILSATLTHISNSLLLLCLRQLWPLQFSFRFVQYVVFDWAPIPKSDTHLCDTFE